MKKPEILYQDASILVCVKPAKVATQTSRVSEQDLLSILKNELYRENRGNQAGKDIREVRKEEPYLAVIHRLDQPVSGILVFARTKPAAANLSSQLQNGSFNKEYLALVTKKPEQQKETLCDWLVRDGKTNTSKVVPEGTKDARRAELSYEVVEAEQLITGKFLPVMETGRMKPEQIRVPEEASLVHIHLKTGRHHQIRVQMAHAGYPLLGDTKYNPEAGKGGWEQIALCAYHLSFRHPETKKKMEFFICPEFLKK